MSTTRLHTMHYQVDQQCTILSPAEVFLGGELHYAWDLKGDTGDTEALKPSRYMESLRQSMQRVTEFTIAARKEYLEGVELTDTHEGNTLKTFEEGGEVTKYKPTGAKRTDNVAPLQGGPYKVVDVGNSRADYKIQRKGTSKKPEDVNVDYIKKLTLRKDTLDDAPPIAPAKKEAKLWQPRVVVGERGRIRGSKQYRILWDDRSTSWEPKENLHDAKEALEAWTEPPKEDKETTKQWDKEELWEIHESPVSTIQHTAEPTNINPVHDISHSKLRK